MRVVHLAAGQGSRLRPLTDDKPKPLVELAGKSLLERNVHTLESVGIEDQLVVTGYEAGQIEALGYKTVHNPVYDETEMVYSLFCARDRFPQDDDLCISYGDIVYDQKVVEALLDCEAPLCVVIDTEWRRLWELRFDDPLSDAETLQIEDDRVVEIGAEPGGYDEIDGQYIGLIKVRRDCVGDFVDAYDTLDQSSIHMTRFIQHLIDTGWQVESVEIDGGWLEVDSLEDLEVYRSSRETGQHTKHLSVL